MTKAYSLDLRRRVVGFVQAGHSRHEAAGRFAVVGVVCCEAGCGLAQDERLMSHRSLHCWRCIEFISGAQDCTCGCSI